MAEQKPISRRLRYEILRRDNNTCQYCGQSAPDVKLTVDHVIARALGGSDDPSNLVAACRDCNAGKSSTTTDAATVAKVDERAKTWAAAIERAAQERRDHDLAMTAMVDAYQKGYQHGHEDAESQQQTASFVGDEAAEIAYERGKNDGITKTLNKWKSEHPDDFKSDGGDI